MNDIQEIISLLKQYLENSVAPNGLLDNVVEYVLPIFSMLVVIVGGIWTVYTYVKGKNREVNEKVLKEVYAPMFQFFVKNDALAGLKESNIDYKEEPLHEWEKRIKKTEIKKDGMQISVKSVPILNLTKKDFLDMFDEVNLGLAPQELVALFSVYKATIFTVSEGMMSKEGRRADTYRTALEYTIRKHAYEGYMKYCKKLGIVVRKRNDLFEIEDDCIKLKLPDLDDFEIRKKQHITSVFGKQK